MERRPVTSLDGSMEDQIKAVKEFFGLRPDQSFQDLDIDEDKEDIQKDGQII